MNVQESMLQERIDPHLSDSNLSRLASEALGESVRVSGYRVLTGGCWNRVISIDASGRHLVVKISPHREDAGIIREFDVLSTFRDSTHLPVPQPHYLDDESGFTPGTALVMSTIPGAVMHECFGLLNYGQRRRITNEIAEHLASLHMIRQSGFGGVELPESGRIPSWPEFWLPRFDAVLKEVASIEAFPQDLVEDAQEVQPHLGELLEVGTVATMTHYDIWSGNVMLDLSGETPHVSGFIDVPGYFADYARELSFAMLFGVADRRFFDAYLQHHDLDDGFELRCSIYNLKMNLRHIQMYPNQFYYQQGAAECLQTIRAHLG